MTGKNSYHSRIMKVYEEIRLEEENALRKRKAEIDRVIPEIKDLDREIGMLSIRTAREMISSPDEISQKAKELKERTVLLRGERIEKLVEHGYPMDYLELKHHCSRCNDTGSVNGARCSCYKNILSELVYRDSDFSHVLQTYSFQNFDIDIFDDKVVIMSTGKTARGLMQENLKAALRYVSDFDRHNENLCLSGQSGTGKTFLATCIARELLNDGHIVVYRTASQLMDDIKEVKFRDNEEISSLLYDSDLLIIDDLGTEMQSDMAKTEIFNVINVRLLNNKKIIISTNLSLGEIKEKYSERLLSRIVGEFINLRFEGEDLRIGKGIQRKNSFLG